MISYVNMVLETISHYCKLTYTKANLSELDFPVNPNKSQVQHLIGLLFNLNNPHEVYSYLINDVLLPMDEGFIIKLSAISTRRRHNFAWTKSVMHLLTLLGKFYSVRRSEDPFNIQCYIPDFEDLLVKNINILAD